MTLHCNEVGKFCRVGDICKKLQRCGVSFIAVNKIQLVARNVILVAQFLNIILWSLLLLQQLHYSITQNELPLANRHDEVELVCVVSGSVVSTLYSHLFDQILLHQLFNYLLLLHQKDLHVFCLASSSLHRMVFIQNLLFLAYLREDFVEVFLLR